MRSLISTFVCWLLLLVVLAIAGCSDSGKSSSSKPDALVFARGSDASKLDPADVDDGESVNTMTQMFEGLVRFKPGTLEVEPWLAEAFSVSDDGLTYTFLIRPGVVFHDGTPLDAGAARYSFVRQMDPDHPAHLADASFSYWNYLYQDVAEVEATGPMELTIRLTQPNASFLASLAIFPAWLISPESYATHGAAMQRNPIGTGPYRFVEWRPSDAVIMERNPEYWGEPASFERLVFRVIPDNTTRLLELQAGRIHGMDGIEPAQAEAIASDPAFTLYSEPGLNVGYLAINAASERLADPELRRAISMAIDRDKLVRLGLDGIGRPAFRPIPPAMAEAFGGERLAKAPAYDSAEAKAIIAARPKAFAKPVRIAIFTGPRIYFPDPQRVGSLLKADLEAAGIPVELTVRDFKSHLYAVRNGQHEMAILGWIGDNGDPDNFLSVFFGSWAARMGSATNISFYKNPEMDAALLRGRSATAPDARADAYVAVHDIWAADLPLIPLVHGNTMQVLRSDVSGYTISKTGNIFLGPTGWAAE